MYLDKLTPIVDTPQVTTQVTPQVTTQAIQIIPWTGKPYFQFLSQDVFNLILGFLDYYYNIYNLKQVSKCINKMCNHISAQPIINLKSQNYWHLFIYKNKEPYLSVTPVVACKDNEFEKHPVKLSSSINLPLNKIHKKLFYLYENLSDSKIKILGPIFGSVPSAHSYQTQKNIKGENIVIGTITNIDQIIYKNKILQRYITDSDKKNFNKVFESFFNEAKIISHRELEFKTANTIGKKKVDEMLCIYSKENGIEKIFANIDLDGNVKAPLGTRALSNIFNKFNGLDAIDKNGTIVNEYNQNLRKNQLLRKLTCLNVKSNH